MPQARGRKGQLLLDFETAFGQDPATPAAIQMPFNSSAVRSSQNLVEDTTIRNRRDPAQPSRGNINVSGAIRVPLDKEAFGYWLKAMFGDPTTSGTGPYVHVFKPGDTQPSVVLEQGFTDIGVFEKFNGCKVSRLSLSFGGDGELSANLDIMGAKETVGAVSYDTTPTGITLVKFNNFQAAIEEGGSALGIGTTVDLEIDFALDGDQYVIGGNGIRGDIPEGIMQVSGTVRAFFQDDTLLNKAIEGTETSLKITLTNGAHILEFNLPEVQYERNSPGIEGPQGVLIELPYRAYYADSADNAAVVVTLTNDVVSY